MRVESCFLGLPEEGVLLSVHPRLQLQGRILPKGRHDEAEEQCDQHKHSRQDNLKHKTGLSRASSWKSKISTKKEMQIYFTKEHFLFYFSETSCSRSLSSPELRSPCGFGEHKANA